MKIDDNGIKQWAGGAFNNHIILEDMQEIYERDLDWAKLQDKTVLITGA